MKIIFYPITGNRFKDLETLYKMRTGRVYEIRCMETNQVYIGSTYKTLRERIYFHVLDSNLTNSTKVMEQDNWTCKIAQKIEVDEDDENTLKALERHYIETTEGIVVNRCLPYRNASVEGTWHDRNKEHVSNKRKERYEEEKQQGINDDIECECGIIIKGQRHLKGHQETQRHKKFMEMTEEQKQVYKEKQVKMQEYSRKSYEKHKEKKLVKDICEYCEKEIVASKMQRHQAGSGCVVECEKCNTKIIKREYERHLKVCGNTDALISKSI